MMLFVFGREETGYLQIIVLVEIVFEIFLAHVEKIIRRIQIGEVQVLPKCRYYFQTLRRVYLHDLRVG